MTNPTPATLSSWQRARDAETPDDKPRPAPPERDYDPDDDCGDRRDYTMDRYANW